MSNQPMTIDQAMALALEHQNAGRLADAESIYRQVLSVNPRNADALHLLGLLAINVGRHDVAVSLISEAVRIVPNAIYFSNLGTALQLCGRREDAIASLRQALTLNLLVSLTSVAGALVAYYALQDALPALPYLLAVAAASFLYVAVADLIPGLHRRVDFRAGVEQLVFIVAGVGLVWLTHQQMH